MRLRFVVKLLNLQRRERRQLDVPDARHNMLVDVVLVICRRGCADGWLCVVLVPELRPLANRVIPALRHINLFEFLHRFLELFLAFALRPREDVLRDWLPRLRIDTCCVPSFPASVLPLADVALPICPFLRHVCSPFLLLNQQLPRGRYNSNLPRGELSESYHLCSLCLWRHRF